MNHQLFGFDQNSQDAYTKAICAAWVKQLNQLKKDNDVTINKRPCASLKEDKWGDKQWVIHSRAFGECHPHDFPRKILSDTTMHLQEKDVHVSHDDVLSVFQTSFRKWKENGAAMKKKFAKK